MSELPPFFRDARIHPYWCWYGRLSILVDFLAKKPYWGAGIVGFGTGMGTSRFLCIKLYSLLLLFLYNITQEGSPSPEHDLVHEPDRPIHRS